MSVKVSGKETESLTGKPLRGESRGLTSELEGCSANSEWSVTDEKGKKRRAKERKLFL